MTEFVWWLADSSMMAKEPARHQPTGDHNESWLMHLVSCRKLSWSWDTRPRHRGQHQDVDQDRENTPVSVSNSTITFKALGSGLLHILQVFSTTTALLEPRIPPPLDYLQFHAIIFHSAHVLFAFLPPPLGTRCDTSSSLWYLWGTSEYSAETETHSHRMSPIVHHLLVFRTTSKHTISALLSPPSDA